MAGVSEVTRILGAIERGEPAAADELLAVVYDELRKLAAYKLAHEAPGQTLQATALVHEAWLRVVGDGNPHFEGRAHFFGAVAEAMRRILIDNARRKKTIRHGGRHERVDIAEIEISSETEDDELLAIHEALGKFSALDQTKAELVKLRYFVGLTLEEAAEILGISEPTAKRYWTYARAWLYQEIQSQKN